MCGILLHFNPNTENLEDEYVEVFEPQLIGTSTISSSNKSTIVHRLIPNITQRGPNFLSLRSKKEYGITWVSSVLSLRKPFTKQSVEANSRYIIQYNGELYGDEIVDNDTKYITSLLQQNTVEDVVRGLSGEFAYSIFDQQSRLLYFGRDPIGKRSLSYKLDHDTGELYVSSVSGRIEGFENCVAGVIYTFDTSKLILSKETKIREADYMVSAAVEDISSIDKYADRLYEQLVCAVRQRLTTIEPVQDVQDNHVAVLFSGGLDCTTIAAIICEQSRDHSNYVVELLNVAFENPRTGMQPCEAPDRLLAVKSAKTLQELYPEVNIKLVKIDVPYDDYLQYRDTVIDMIFPKDTEMDLSIAIAFYFASRGQGYLEDRGERFPYQRNALVLFSGLGADELYGGYHKLANKSNEELVIELSRQINNIHDRNLNRDDKVIACHGVEARYPFLDQDVVDLSTQLPINYKINKMVLRNIASRRLQLSEISCEPKRAIQFGAKSAKMTKDGNKHGTDRLK
ncbi:HER233Cp [Eremothecium sinecaudum]|uniref:HER233Cp n=1 Tax=Eremothecium sinecaudum TaxID=45286 RepID=A0A109UZM3_9SACH|nr:HER233Cp [Eremothecium sinecaudum]AMD21511.1 HER233Cp [Eremothecium sinecaudum]